MLNIDYDRLKKFTAGVLMSDDYRGGPLQRQYPPAVIQAMVEAIATEVEDIVLDAEVQYQGYIEAQEQA